MLTRRQPVAIAAASDSSSRMPPLISTLMSRVPTISREQVAVVAAAERRVEVDEVDPLGAPASCQFSAASTGSPKRFSEPATPCTSCTAWPPAMSTAGSSSR